jgi:predicted ribonuclease toxin of YeeF-YezG toxin-antitoxin module
MFRVKLGVLICMIGIVVSGCSKPIDKVNEGSSISRPNNNTMVQNVKISPTVSSTVNSRLDNGLLKLMNSYFEDIKEQTNREVTKEQQKLILNYINKNPIHKLDKDTTAERRKEFNKVRSRLLKEWEQHTGSKWVTYSKDVLNDKGKVIRKKGSNYDAHHIIELSYNGANVWWNMHPAAFPNEHQVGIHRKGGIASKLFDGELD